MRARARRAGAAFAATAACAVIAALLLPAASAAERGDLDPSFGHRGYAAVEALETSAALVVRPDGTLLVAGGDDEGRHARIAALDSEGDVVAGFGDAGVAAAPAPLEAAEDLEAGSGATALLLTSGEEHAHITRFGPTGQLDPSFGAGGVATVDHELQGIELDSEGRVLAFGFEGILRLLPNGTPDPSFGVGGEVDLRVVEAVPDTQDRVLVADHPGSTLRYLRLDENGNWDQSFPLLYDTDRDHMRQMAADGDDGAWTTTRRFAGRSRYSRFSHVLANGSFGPEFGNDFFPAGPLVADDGDDAVLSGGGARVGYPDAEHTATFVRGLEPSAIDAQFGTDGHAYLYPAAEPVFASALTVDGAGRTLIATTPFEQLGAGVLVARLLAAGTGADADADTLADGRDRCPAIPGPRRHRGCPKLEPRQLSFGVTDRRPHGRVSGPRACAVRIPVRVLRLSKHRRPKRVVTVVTDYRGRWQGKRALRAGRYRAVARRSYGDGTGLCAEVRSRTVTIP